MQALHDIGVPKEDVSVIPLDHTVKRELSGSQVGVASDNAATGTCIDTAAVLLSVHEGAHSDVLAALQKGGNCRG